MADETAPTAPKEFTRRQRIAFAALSLLWCFATVSYLIRWGESGNTLHSSALGWACTIAGGILAAIGFGSVAPLVPGFKK